MNKDRITMLFYVNQTEEKKLQSLLIGKTKQLDV